MDRYGRQKPMDAYGNEDYLQPLKIEGRLPRFHSR